MRYADAVQRAVANVRGSKVAPNVPAMESLLAELVTDLQTVGVLQAVSVRTPETGPLERVVVTLRGELLLRLEAQPRPRVVWGNNAFRRRGADVVPVESVVDLADLLGSEFALQGRITRAIRLAVLETR